MTTPTHLHYCGGSLPIVAVTATHFHFHAYGAERRISRAAIAATGSVWHPEISAELFLSPPPAPSPTLEQLRRAAADAHPDRGGTAGAFMAAHAAYLEAKGRAAV